MNPVLSCELAPGVMFHTIHDSRFKTMRLTAGVFLPLKEETAARNLLLCYMLVRCCEKYPDFTTLSRRLSSLYGADLNASVVKMGDMQLLSISADGIDDRYSMDGDSISESISELLCEVIFKPKLICGRFDEDDLLQEKRQALDMIDSDFNDKRTYALQRFNELMYEDDPYGVKRYGSAERIKEVTAEDVCEAWTEMLESARFEFIFAGGSSSEKAQRIIKNSFKEINRVPVSLSVTPKKYGEKVKELTEEMDVSQCKLVMGFVGGCSRPDPEIEASVLMTTILGGSAASKLFTNVREKKSLCYYCSASYSSLKGVMIVECGVDVSNIEAAKEAILAEIEDLKNGNISEFELNSAKLAQISGFYAMLDSAAGLCGWVRAQVMDSSFETPEKKAEKYSAFTSDDVIKAARKLRLDTVYVLTPGDGGERGE